MRLVIAFCVLSAAFAAGCSSVSVKTDYDRAFDFSGYETFGWLPRSQMPAADPVLTSGLIGKRIVGAVEAELEKKGFRQDGKAPDFRLSWFVTVRDRTQITERGYRYGRYRYSGYRSIDVHTYQVGSLVIDVIDTEKKELVWRGIASGVVGSSPGSEERIREAVGKVLAEFPPR